MFKEIIVQGSNHYGKDANLTIQRGGVHKYLVMILEYRTQGKVKINIVEYLYKVLGEIP